MCGGAEHGIGFGTYLFVCILERSPGPEAEGTQTFRGFGVCRACICPVLDRDAGAGPLSWGEMLFLFPSFGQIELPDLF